MLRNKMIVAMFVAALVAFAPAAWAGSDDAVVGVTATVDSFAEWSDATPTIAAGDFAGSVDGTTVSAAGEDLTVTKGLTLYANATITITAAGTTNSGIATQGTTSDTLTTSYQLQGADLTTPDGAYKAAGTAEGEFFYASNSYEVTHTNGDGSYAMNLLVKLESEDAAASDAGSYTCSVTLTATWS